MRSRYRSRARRTILLPEQWFILGLLGATVILLITEVVPPGVSGLLVIGGLIAGERLHPGTIAPDRAAFGGLIDGAVIAVGSMFVISAGVRRTGAIGLLTEFFARPGTPPRKTYLRLLVLVMVLSAFLNNTPLVLIFMPLFIGLAQRMDTAPSRVLIPLSFVSIMGGLCTKIGTSTNIIVASAVRDDLDIGLFAFTPVGVVLALSGLAFLVLFAARLLPERPSLDLLSGSGVATEYMTEIELRSNSPLVGRTVAEAFGPEASSQSKNRARILQVIRRDVIHPAQKDMILVKGDLLLVKGDPTTIVALTARQDTGVIPAVNLEESGEAPLPRRVAQSLVEVIVAPSSRFVGHRVAEVRFRDRWGVSVFAVQRHGEHLREKVDELRLKGGDILLVQGTPEAVRNLKLSESFLVVEGVHAAQTHTNRAPVALLGVAVFVLLAMAFPSDVHIAALVGALVVVIGRCVTAAEAYASLDWDVLFLLGGTLALGSAFTRTGLAELAAREVVTACAPFGPAGGLVGIFVFTLCITQVLSNNAAAAIMTPLAYRAGIEFAGQDGAVATPEAALPFVLAVAFGASCCFLTPIGYGTNLLVYGPGGYRFTDFLRIGVPLTLLFTVLGCGLLVVLYG